MKVNQRLRDLFGSEAEYVARLGAAISDPHDKKEFWENIKARKEADSGFSIYDLFPTQKKPKNMAQKYCGEILEMLRGKKKT